MGWGYIQRMISLILGCNHPDCIFYVIRFDRAQIIVLKSCINNSVPYNSFLFSAPDFLM